MPSKRLKNWKTIPMWRRRSCDSSSSVRPVTSSPGDRDRPLVGDIEPGDQVEERRFAATGRAHERHEVPGRDHQVGAPQRPHRCVLRLERLPDFVYDQGVHVSFLLSPGRRRTGMPSSTSLYAITGVSRPFTNWGGRATVSRATSQASTVPWETTISPASASCWSRWDMLTVSPTRVYSSRSSEPRRAAAASPVERPRPETERRQALVLPPPVDGRLLLVHGQRRHHGPVGVVHLLERCAEHGHHRIPDELHDGAVLAEDGVVHGGAVDVELPRQLARVSMFGDGGVRADVAHQNGDDHPLGLTDLAAIAAELLGQTAGKEPRQRLPLFLAVHDRLVQQPEALQRALCAGRHTLRQLDEDCLDLGIDRFGRAAAWRRRWP